jgi:hypothetical protein
VQKRIPRRIFPPSPHKTCVICCSFSQHHHSKRPRRRSARSVPDRRRPAPLEVENPQATGSGSKGGLANLPAPQRSFPSEAIASTKTASEKPMGRGRSYFWGRRPPRGRQDGALPKWSLADRTPQSVTSLSGTIQPLIGPPRPCIPPWAGAPRWRSPSPVAAPRPHRRSRPTAPRRRLPCPQLLGRWPCSCGRR